MSFFYQRHQNPRRSVRAHSAGHLSCPSSRSRKNLPDMIEKATDQSLKNGFETHLAQTKGQIVRLEKVFQMHGVEAKGVDCPAIDGILKEASEVAGDIDDKSVLDAPDRRRPGRRVL